MARIRAYTSETVTHITVSGRLTAGDMGRFERACAPALTTRAAALVIDLSRMIDADPAAEAWLSRMQARGACIQHRTRE